VSFTRELQEAINARFPRDRVDYWPGWRQPWFRAAWAGRGGRPVALVLHHTGGAATASTDPTNPGNRHGANDAQIRYVARHPTYEMPCSAFSIDRDGCLTVNAALPVYHAGAGSFRGTRWESLGVPDDSANSYCLGVEIIDRGQGSTYTPAMKQAVARLAQVCAIACRWPDTGTLYLPRHRDWTSRKVDIRYANTTVQKWVAAHP
jgi:hypothetical protein